MCKSSPSSGFVAVCFKSLPVSVKMAVFHVDRAWIKACACVPCIKLAQSTRRPKWAISFISESDQKCNGLTEKITAFWAREQCQGVIRIDWKFK